MSGHDPPETVPQPSTVASGAITAVAVREANRGRLVNGAADRHVLPRYVRNFYAGVALFGRTKDLDNSRARDEALGVTTAT